MVFNAPIDWSTIYAALYAWANGATGWTTRWADQGEPRPDYPYVLLDVIQSRLEGGLAETTVTTDLTRARDIRLTPTVQNNTLYRVSINGTDFDYTSDADASAAEITAGLVSAIGGGAEPVTATDGGTYLDIVGDGEVLNPSIPRLFNYLITDNLTAANNDTGNEVEVEAKYRSEITVNVQAFQRNSPTSNAAIDPSANAYNALTILQASLGLPSVQAQLRAAKLAVIEELDITDLSEAVDGDTLSRASFDIRFRTAGSLFQYVGYIDRVTGEGTYSGTRTPAIVVPYDTSGA